jgi:hypothetical protein
MHKWYFDSMIALRMHKFQLLTTEADLGIEHRHEQRTDKQVELRYSLKYC